MNFPSTAALSGKTSLSLMQIHETARKTINAKGDATFSQTLHVQDWTAADEVRVPRFPSHALQLGYTNTTAGPWAKAKCFSLDTEEEKNHWRSSSWLPAWNLIERIRGERGRFAKKEPQLGREDTNRETESHTVRRDREEAVWPEFSNALVCHTWTEFVGQISMKGLGGCSRGRRERQRWAGQADRLFFFSGNEGQWEKEEQRTGKSSKKRRHWALWQCTPFFSVCSCFNWDRGKG